MRIRPIRPCAAAVRSVCGLVALAGALVVHAAAPESRGQSAEQRGAAIMQSIGTAACDDDAQCRVIGIGARSCGGPQQYVAWSIAHTDEAALRRAVDDDARASARELEKAGINSTCVVLPVPGVHCLRPEGQDAGGRCALLEHRSGRAPVR
ncbi:MAG TPA: hypothetical protein VGR63_08385 [Casimicrobiaceae bacterium]|nr:hypothetical protein [Casimicrobiaceae bacterium]